MLNLKSQIKVRTYYMILLTWNFSIWKLTHRDRKKSVISTNPGCWVGSRGRDFKGMRKTFGWNWYMWRVQACQHSSHVHFTYMWSIVGHSHISQAVMNAWWHELLVWSGREHSVFLIMLFPSGTTTMGTQRNAMSTTLAVFSPDCVLGTSGTLAHWITKMSQ